jgi:hypothetical protein
MGRENTPVEPSGPPGRLAAPAQYRQAAIFLNISLKRRLFR